jgi:CRP/FNR family transcriptional regulator, cyclic AMP receptor protein
MNSPYGLALAENCLVCNLRSDSFFCALPKPSLEAFERIKNPSSYPAGAIIFVEGQPSRGIFLLCQGRAKLSANAKDGRTLILRIAQPGEVLGLRATVMNEPYELTVETMQPCQLNYVKREDFLRFLKEHGDACLHAAQHLGHDCGHAYELIRSIGLSHSASERLARLLLESASDGQTSEGVVRVKLPLTHEEISQLIGTSRETVTRAFAEFKKNRVAELKGSTLIIRDRAALERLVAS